MPLYGVDALVAGIDAVLEEFAVEAGDVSSGEAAVRVNGEEHEADAVFGKQAECLIYATQPREGGQVITGPEVDDADIGISIITFGKLGALMQHVAFGVALRTVPSEHALAVGHTFAGAFLKPLLVYEQFVADDAGNYRTYLLGFDIKLNN